MPHCNVYSLTAGYILLSICHHKRVLFLWEIHLTLCCLETIYILKWIWHICCKPFLNFWFLLFIYWIVVTPLPLSYHQSFTLLVVHWHVIPSTHTTHSILQDHRYLNIMNSYGKYWVKVLYIAIQDWSPLEQLNWLHNIWLANSEGGVAKVATFL